MRQRIKGNAPKKGLTKVACKGYSLERFTQGRACEGYGKEPAKATAKLHGHFFSSSFVFTSRLTTPNWSTNYLPSQHFFLQHWFGHMFSKYNHLQTPNVTILPNLSGERSIKLIFWVFFSQTWPSLVSRQISHHLKVPPWCHFTQCGILCLLIQKFAAFRQNSKQTIFEETTT